MIYATLDFEPDNIPVLIYAIDKTVLFGTQSSGVIAYNFSTHVLTQMYQQNNEAPDRIIDLRVFTRPEKSKQEHA